MRIALANWRKQAVADGFTAFKSMAVPSTMPLEGNAPVSLCGALRGGDARGGRPRH
ncbi:MAG: hypothetical protein V9H26_13085 [Verrucomicrobiota bacterium]